MGGMITDISLSYSVVDFINAYLYCATVIVAVLSVAIFAPRKSRFALRLSLSILAILAAVTLFTVGVMYIKNPNYYVWVHSFKFLSVFLLSGVMAYVCFNVSIWEALFFAVAGYCMQHIGARVWDFIILLSNAKLHRAASMILSAVLNFAVTAAFYFAYIRRALGNRRPRVYYKTQMSIAAVVVFVSIFYNSFGISYANGTYILLTANGLSSALAVRSMVFVYVTTTIIAYLAFSLSFSSNYLQSAAEDKRLLNEILEERRVQYEKESANVKALNTRLHDIKHYLSALNTEDDKREILSEVEGLDAFFNTGNEALNVLLTSKSIACAEKSIRFNSMIDGKRLNFIPKFELYALFGNAIDNAMESAEKLPKEKRIISISQKVSDEGLSIYFENYCASEVAFKGGLPQTNKDRSAHGLGFKSMKQLAEKNGGTLKAEVFDDEFVLTIFFPKK